LEERSHDCVPEGSNSAQYLFPPNEAQAWAWYEKAVQAGEPNALARFAEKEEHAALAAENPETRNAHLLEAFGY